MGAEKTLSGRCGLSSNISSAASAPWAEDEEAACAKDGCAKDGCAMGWCTKYGCENHMDGA